MLPSGIFVWLIILLATSKPTEGSTTNFEVDGCTLEEPVYDYSFDFNRLKSDFGHQIKNEHGDEIEFNVCGPINGSRSKNCTKNSDSYACLTKKDGTSITLGKNHKLHYDNGKMYFAFSGGDKCTNNTDYNLIVAMKCDYTLDVQEFSMVSTNDSECSFYLNWEREDACLPLPDHLKSKVCMAEDQQTGNKFDLMPLSDSNHKTIDRIGSYFIINVCKPVLYGENAMCPADSGICYVNKTETDIRHKYLNYGIAQADPVYENGELIMKFPTNDKCNETANFTSIIYFVCDPSIKNEMPEFGGQHRCIYKFVWVTSLACNHPKQCTAFDPETRKQYDFNSIAGVYNVTHEDKHYMFGICKNAGSPCAENDGACEITNSQSISLGDSTSILNVNGTGSLYVNYNSETNCTASDNSTKKWSTKIEFICPTESSDQGPKIIENKNCLLIIAFKTSLACKKQILCTVDNGKQKFNLTPLINVTGNYIATINETSVQLNKTSKFYLNVCRPLVAEYGLSCPGGSAACIATVEGSSMPEHEQSIGYPVGSLTSYDSKAQLKYLYGDKCPDDESEKMSTTINFKCSIKAGKGQPILQSIIKRCHYQFDWLTNVMCPAHECNFSESNCTVTNPSTGKTFDFRNAKFTNSGKITIAEKEKSFQVDICGPNRTVSTVYSQEMIKVIFDTTTSNYVGPCGTDGHLNVYIHIICGENATNIVHSENDPCQIIFIHHTTEICEFVGLSEPQQSTTVAPTTATTTTTTTTTKTTTAATTTAKQTTTVPNSTTPIPPANATDSSLHPHETKSKMVTTAAAVIGVTMIIIVIVSIVFLRDPNKRMAVKDFLLRNSPSVLYRRINTREEANLLLTRNHPEIDSDDDLIL